MTFARVLVVTPTLHGGPPLRACLEALTQQTFRDFRAVVVDNSAARVARAVAPAGVEILENKANVGFGAAINQAAAAFPSEFVCALNDDARPWPDFLEKALEAFQDRPDVGMCAPAILLSALPGRLDSAGLSLYPDGTAKQRGRGRPAAEFAGETEAFFPSGCAAVYRRAMLERIGLFDEDYFLYCEDADLGLRGRLAGWRCAYHPKAVVEHGYSGSAGRASRLKAFLVERNRLFTVVKDFPLSLCFAVPLFTVWRYLAHLRAALAGQGLAGEFAGGWRGLVMIVWSAHWQTLRRLPGLLRKRAAVQKTSRLNGRRFLRLLRRYGVTAAEIARQ